MGTADLRHQHYQSLHSEVSRASCASLLVRLQKDEALFSAFGSWPDVARSGKATDDKILRPIFAEYSRDQDPRWRTILLFLFWSSLDELFRIKCRLDKNRDEVWSKIHWFFLQAVCRLDASQRPKRIAQKIYNDTAHDVSREYREERIHPEGAWPETEDGTPLEVAAPDLGQMEVTEELNRHWRGRFLRKLRDRGSLKEADYLLLLGTEVYGGSLQNQARMMGLSYEAAKKRRQRALEGLCENPEIAQKIRDFLSP